MQNNPIVDILVPTFNRGFLLQNCINTLLKQKYSNFNIIIADNCSTDNTQELVSHFVTAYENVFYFKNPENYGIYGNYNHALAHYCKGEYTIIVSDDDYILDYDYLTTAVTYIQAEKLSWIAAGYYIADTTSMQIKCNTRDEDFFGTGVEFMQLHQWGYDKFSWFSVLFDRKKMLKLDGFTKSLYNSDFDQLFELSIDSRCAILASPVGVYTINIFQENHLIDQDFMFHGYTLYTNLHKKYPQHYKESLMIENVKAYISACFRYFLDRDAFEELHFNDVYWFNTFKNLSNGIYYPFFDNQIAQNYELFKKDKMLFAQHRKNNFSSSWKEIEDPKLLTLLSSFLDYKKIDL